MSPLVPKVLSEILDRNVDRDPEALISVTLPFPPIWRSDPISSDSIASSLENTGLWLRATFATLLVVDPSLSEVLRATFVKLFVVAPSSSEVAVCFSSQCMNSDPFDARAFLGSTKLWLRLQPGPVGFLIKVPLGAGAEEFRCGLVVWENLSKKEFLEAGHLEQSATQLLDRSKTF